MKAHRPLRLHALAGAVLLAVFLTSPVLAQQQSEPPAQVLPPAPSDDYKLGPKDRIRVSVQGLSDLDTTATIGANGTIRMSLIGDIVAEGLTVRGLENVLASALERYVNEPQVTVVIEQYQSQSFFMYGAINRAGSYPITGRVTLLEALVQAGGMNPTEALGPINIVRRDFPQEPIEIDGRELFFNGNQAYDIEIEPGDMINVVSKPEYHIYIYDEQGQGGALTFRDPVTLLQAVARNGGLGQGASKKIRIVRTLEDGTKETFEVDFGEILEGKREDMVLQPEDVIIIKRGFF